jgi:glycine betaine/choline ABC-type transport system substrate-binding protein
MQQMQRFLRVAALAAVAALLVAACGSTEPEGGGGGGGGGTAAKNVTVKLGSNDFTEQFILGQIYKQGLEKAGYTVQYQEGLGAREVVFPALESGQLDMYVEYAGSALQILAKKAPDKDANKVLADLTQFLATKGVKPLQQAPMEDKNALSVTKQTAEKYNLTTISDLAKVPDKLVMGGPPECKDRATCYKGLQQAYGLQNLSFKSISQGGLKYSALANGDIQVALSFTTDGPIAKQGLVVLQDDKGVFPPDHAVPVVRQAFLDSAGSEFEQAVNKLTAAITTEEITKLNAKVDLDKEEPADVAGEWLKEKGLV